jgi:hypothetical protein
MVVMSEGIEERDDFWEREEEKEKEQDVDYARAPQPGNTPSPDQSVRLSETQRTDG